MNTRMKASGSGYEVEGGYAEPVTAEEVEAATGGYLSSPLPDENIDSDDSLKHAPNRDVIESVFRLSEIRHSNDTAGVGLVNRAHSRFAAGIASILASP